MTVTANYTPLTPQSFLRRNARVYPEKTAVIHGQRRHTYRELYERSCRQANALLKLGLGRGDNVAVFMPNIPEHLEACNGIHMAGAVMVALNYRLSGPEIAYILNHSQARVLLVDEEFLPLVVGIRGQLEYLENIVAIRNGLGQNIQWPEDAHEYEGWISGASTADPMILPEDENDVISINYTSGTTGNPKGVMYTHRSVYINALCNLLEVGMGADSVYLWTLPMFHCNGWCYVWGVTALGATHVCLRALSPRTIIREIMDRGVTHLCGAPIVLKMIVEGAGEEGIAAFSQGLTVSTAAAPPSPRIIGQMLALNARVIHVYGLTETYGPITVCEMQPDWKPLPVEEKAGLMARQGVPYMLCEDITVLDGQGNAVVADGKTMGEVCMKGNIVMKGYYKDQQATEKVLRNGWFHSGDLGVLHPDGYIELQDRAKDIIISGGENISTIEVENALYKHPAVGDVAVVSRPDEKWGEVPVAFVTLGEGKTASEEELILHCREYLAGFKAPKSVFFEKLPRTSTGKIKKYELRERMWAGRKKKIQG